MDATHPNYFSETTRRSVCGEDCLRLENYLTNGSGPRREWYYEKCEESFDCEVAFQREEKEYGKN